MEVKGQNGAELENTEIWRGIGGPDGDCIWNRGSIVNARAIRGMLAILFPFPYLLALLRHKEQVDDGPRYL